MTEKEEFEKAGFTDYEAKLYAWLNYPEQIYLRAPDGPSFNWNTQSWLRFVDWSLPGNKRVLEQSRREMSL